MSAPERHHPEQHLSRRREAYSRGSVRRRRAALAIAGLMGLVAVVLIVLLVSSGGGVSPARSGAALHGASQARATKAGEHAVAGASRNGQGAAGTNRAALGSASIPILIYHVIAHPPPGAPFPGLYVSPGELAAQMRALYEAGYHAVTMDQVLAYWREGTPLPRGKPVVLSFDNGYQSQYTQALPILRRYGWVGVENLQLAGLPPSQGGISEAQVRGLIAAGWELDTQGYSHAELTTLSPAELHFQVTVARETLEHRYGVPVNWFCYPSGHYDPVVVAEVKAAGYLGSTTVVPGWASPNADPYRLPRIRVLGGTSPQALIELIAGTRNNSPPPAAYT